MARHMRAARFAHSNPRREHLIEPFGSAARAPAQSQAPQKPDSAGPRSPPGHGRSGAQITEPDRCATADEADSQVRPGHRTPGEVHVE